MFGVLRKEYFNVDGAGVTAHAADTGKFPVAFYDVFEPQLVRGCPGAAYLFHHDGAFKPPARAGSKDVPCRLARHRVLRVFDLGE